jgi:hypothetical protein
MNKKYELRINEEGIDHLNYRVLHKSGVLIAKVILRINQKKFVLKKNSDCLNSLNRKINTAIRNLKSKSQQKRGKYVHLDLTG